MIEILDESEKDVLAVRIEGQLSSADYDKLRPEMELRADRAGTFSMVVELSGVEALEPGAIRDDLSFTKDFAGDIDRMAIVTDQPVWQGLSDLVGKPVATLLGVKVERFDDRVEAWKWLRS